MNTTFRNLSKNNQDFLKKIMLYEEIAGVDIIAYPRLLNNNEYVVWMSLLGDCDNFVCAPATDINFFNVVEYDILPKIYDLADISAAEIKMKSEIRGIA